ncbi:MAG: FAD-binding oxidoreductase [Dehalococcoidia bacterium]|jgi:glycolate oxidase|nr:FAD-binding oxidoreductase [Dehalococcoidia bacterium]
MINVDALKRIVGNDWVVTARDQITGYLADETYLGVLPKPADNVVVVKPANPKEISEILKLANKEKTPVYPRGGGTGLVGAAVPTRDGIVLSLERLDKVIEVDKENMMVVSEAGVTLEHLLKSVENADLLFPPHPGDEGAQVGGMIACNAGGTRAVKYGVVRNYVKGLEVVLPTGEIVTMGGKLLKNNTGLDLMHLIIDSEGILGIITKATMRLYPKFGATATLVVSFDDRRAAIGMVPKILQAGVIPMAIEYTEKSLMEMTAKHVNMTWPAKQGTAQTIIIMAESNEDQLYGMCEQISSIAEKNGAVDVLMAETSAEQTTILKIRSEVGNAVKSKVCDALDVTVPPAAIPDMLDALDKVGEKYGIFIPVVGHAGDGNLHPNMMWEYEKKGVLKAAKHDIYEAAIKLGGVISGEHGIGKTRLEVLPMNIDPKSRELMCGIKKLFDPNGILSPDSAIC